MGPNQGMVDLKKKGLFLTIKVEYLSNYWSDLTKILNLTNLTACQISYKFDTNAQMEA